MEHIWNIFGTHLGHIWNTLGTRLEHIWSTSGTYLERIWNAFGTQGNAFGTHFRRWERIWKAFGTLGTHLERILGPAPTNEGPMSIDLT